MSLATTGRIAGFTLLVYIAAGIAGLVLSQNAIGEGDTAAQLAAMAANADTVRVAVLLDLLCCFCALTLGAAFYVLTATQNAMVAVLAMVCRVVEGVLIAGGVSERLSLFWLSGAGNTGETATLLLSSFLMRNEVALTSTFFAVGSLLFSCLLLKGRLIPAPLAWLGVAASAVLVVVLPPQLAGFLSGGVLTLAWLPMLAFEVPLGLWLIVRGVRSPATMTR